MTARFWFLLLLSVSWSRDSPLHGKIATDEQLITCPTMYRSPSVQLATLEQQLPPALAAAVCKPISSCGRQLRAAVWRAAGVHQGRGGDGLEPETILQVEVKHRLQTVRA